MSIKILSYMHVLSWRADLVKKGTFLGIIILIFFAFSLRHCTAMTCYYVKIEISGKTQNYRLKSVCNFKVTRLYLILP